jgi:DNA-binding CsgD family transcriptional regulator
MTCEDSNAREIRVAEEVRTSAYAQRLVAGVGTTHPGPGCAGAGPPDPTPFPSANAFTLDCRLVTVWRVARAVTCSAAWMELVGDILTRPAGAQPFPHDRVADLLLESFHAACCSRNVVDEEWVDHVVGGWPVDYLPMVPPSGRVIDATTQPLLRWYWVTRSTAPQILGRVPSAVARPEIVEEWSAFARPLGITHQLALPLLVASGVEAYVVSRPDDDYDDADADLAALVLPALSALVRQRGVLETVSAARYDPVRSLGLTERELAVLTLLGDGLTAVAIAHRLRTSPRTVQKHLERLYRKLGVRDRLMAVQRARDSGILPGPVGRGGRSSTGRPGGSSPPPRTADRSYVALDHDTAPAR